MLEESCGDVVEMIVVGLLISMQMSASILLIGAACKSLVG